MVFFVRLDINFAIIIRHILLDWLGIQKGVSCYVYFFSLENPESFSVVSVIYGFTYHLRN